MGLGSPASLLKNTQVDIIRRSSIRDLKTGSKDESTKAVYEGIDAKIESDSSENPLKIFGIELHSWYLLHLWKDENNEEYHVRVGDMVKDNTRGKEYKIIKDLAARLHKLPVHHYEFIMIVYGDDRFDNFIMGT